ncbi:M56 family metallopeptidase [Aquimarina sp. MMG016]|uniref:M56 family metallopeptidase n=1 Tax=Aquimarina sp. MMG016 TaxID=2822690 RepID=UPI001B3A16EB|nr:M56 family metallopeptidase [Aquimarina sp. MMG016]MBQ4821656.1 M56 family metallopeptidase [Aquimarina sp. MMG016]
MLEVFYSGWLDFLLDSIWVGGVFWLFLWMCLKIINGKYARVRYYISLFVLVGFLLALFVISFGYNSIYQSWLKPKIMILMVDYTPEHQPISFDFIDKVQLFIVTYNYYICLFWFLGTMIYLVKLFNQSRAIKSIQETGISDYGLDVLKTDLLHKLGIHREVVIKFIRNGSHPFTVGYFKPIVYFPIQVITGFSADELELILFHELIHIKRNDYLINLIQLWVEAIFFFNPFVRHISKMVKNEREASCDYNVINEGYSKLMYAKALERSYELHYDLALSFGSQNVFSRIKNLTWFQTSTRKQNKCQSILLGLFAAGFIFMTLGFGVFTKNDFLEKVIAKDVIVYPRFYVNIDTLIFQMDEHRHVHLYCETEYSYYEDGIMKNDELWSNFEVKEVYKGDYTDITYIDKFSGQIIASASKRKDNSDWNNFQRELSGYCLMEPDDVIRGVQYALLGAVYLYDERIPNDLQKKYRTKYPNAFPKSRLTAADSAFLKQIVYELQKDKLVDPDYEKAQVAFNAKPGGVLLLNNVRLSKKHAEKYYIYLEQTSGKHFYEGATYRIK